MPENQKAGADAPAPQTERDPLRLYRVSVEFELVVLARNTDEANATAEMFASEEMDNQRPLLLETPIARRTSIPAGWANAIPYKPVEIENDFTVDEQDRSVSDWLALISGEPPAGPPEP